MEDLLLKSLHTIALGHAEGKVSIDLLQKACDTYKVKTGFDDGIDYQIILSKSLFDQLNGVPQDEELCKAILPGDTKVVDGVLYQWSGTKVGSKTQYAWHVVKRGSVTGKNIGAGDKQSAQRIIDLEKYVNELFPKDLSVLKVKQSAGGSTGAKIVEDTSGDRYVMKRGDMGPNTNNDHVINEYLANQLYAIAGVKVPQFQLYNEGGTAVLLSRFIYNAHPVTPKDYPLLAKSFIVDCLFDNRDAYANSDNCLIDSKGQLIHVDNGASLTFRAHGANKNFDDNILGTFTSMQQYNPNVASALDDDDILRQIKEIRLKKDDLVNYLKEVGEDTLAATIGRRIDNMTDIVNAIENKKNIGKRKVLPRNLKPEKEMYREFTPKELDDLWKKFSGSGIDKVTDKRTNPGTGWVMLSEVCKMRGFDARADVVDDKKYWEMIDKGVKEGKFVQLLRGLSPNDKIGYKGKITIEQAVDSLLYDDVCFYGTQAAYGQGIYSHLVDSGKNTDDQSFSRYKKTGSYTQAKEYANEAGIGKGAIVRMCIQPGTKIAKFEDLVNEIKNSGPGVDSKAVAKVEKEIAELDKKMFKIDNDIAGMDKKVIEQAYKDAQYDEQAWKTYSQEELLVDWGKTDAFGDRDIPSYKDFVLGKMADLVRANGGKVIPKKGLVVFQMPHSDEEISISEYQYDGPYSIKRVSNFSPKFNHAVMRFNQWFERTHVKYAEDVKNDALKTVKNKTEKLMTERQKLNDERLNKKKELEVLRNPGKKVDPNKGVYEAIYDRLVNHYSNDVVGLYAALKGYDMVSKEDGNGRGNSYYIILNRSKLVIDKEVEMYV